MRGLSDVKRSPIDTQFISALVATVCVTFAITIISYQYFEGDIRWVESLKALGISAFCGALPKITQAAAYYFKDGSNARYRKSIHIDIGELLNATRKMHKKNNQTSSDKSPSHFETHKHVGTAGVFFATLQAKITAQPTLRSVIISGNSKAQISIQELKNATQAFNVDIYVMPESADEYLATQQDEKLNKTLVLLNERPIPHLMLVLKEVMDILFAFFALFCSIPIIILAALVIMSTSRGPIFFVQSRHGVNHVPFVIYKFRTMHVQNLVEKKHVKQAIKGDKRVIKFGHFLRRSSIDELPQLLNVLKGDMSIVGPRPHEVSHGIQFEALFDTYPSRHRVKPGITGLAQIKGCRGLTDTKQKIKKRLNYDLFYVNHWSFWLDVKILLLSVGAVINGKNAN